MIVLAVAILIGCGLITITLNIAVKAIDQHRHAQQEANDKLREHLSGIAATLRHQSNVADRERDERVEAAKATERLERARREPKPGDPGYREFRS